MSNFSGASNLVPRAFPLKNGWAHPFFKGKALGTRLRSFARVKRGRRSPIAKINWKPMKTRKFGYDVAYACPPVRTHTSCNSMPDVRLFWRESVWPPASCEAETTKESVPSEILLKKKIYMYIYIPDCQTSLASFVL